MKEQEEALLTMPPGGGAFERAKVFLGLLNGSWDKDVGAMQKLDEADEE